MTSIIIRHGDGGEITGWKYSHGDRSASENEIEVSVGDIHPRELRRMMVDTSVDPPELVEDPDFEPAPTAESVDEALDDLTRKIPVKRKEVSETSKQNFRDARDAGDTQTQLDILFEIVTGEQP